MVALGIVRFFGIFEGSLNNRMTTPKTIRDNASLAYSLSMVRGTTRIMHLRWLWRRARGATLLLAMAPGLVLVSSQESSGLQEHGPSRNTDGGRRTREYKWQGGNVIIYISVFTHRPSVVQ